MCASWTTVTTPEEPKSRIDLDTQHLRRGSNKSVCGVPKKSKSPKTSQWPTCKRGRLTSQEALKIILTTCSSAELAEPGLLGLLALPTSFWKAGEAIWVGRSDTLRLLIILCSRKETPGKVPLLTHVLAEPEKCQVWLSRAFGDGGIWGTNQLL